MSLVRRKKHDNTGSYLMIFEKADLAVLFGGQQNSKKCQGSRYVPETSKALLATLGGTAIAHNNYNQKNSSFSQLRVSADAT